MCRCSRDCQSSVRNLACTLDYDEIVWIGGVYKRVPKVERHGVIDQILRSSQEPSNSDIGTIEVCFRAKTIKPNFCDSCATWCVWRDCTSWHCRDGHDQS